MGKEKKPLTDFTFDISGGGIKELVFNRRGDNPYSKFVDVTVEKLQERVDRDKSGSLVHIVRVLKGQVEDRSVIFIEGNDKAILGFTTFDGRKKHQDR